MGWNNSRVLDGYVSFWTDVMHESCYLRRWRSWPLTGLCSGLGLEGLGCSTGQPYCDDIRNDPDQNGVLD